MYLWLNVSVVECGLFCRVKAPQEPSPKGNGAVFTLSEVAARLQPTLCIWLSVVVLVRWKSCGCLPSAVIGYGVRPLACFLGFVNYAFYLSGCLCCAN
jgi:hypothetical protein